MGICASCEATAVGPAPTAKVITSNGDVREYDHQIKVSTFLDNKSDYFVCDADDMEFDEYLKEVGLNDKIRLGQIYFVLPRSMLKRRMRADDLAALAVKASKALVNGRNHATPLVFGTGLKKEEKSVVSGRRRNYVADLSVIPE